MQWSKSIIHGGWIFQKASFRRRSKICMRGKIVVVVIWMRLHGANMSDETLWSNFEEQLKIIRNNKTIKGACTSFGAIELVFADMPTNIAVNDIGKDDATPNWNKWSKSLNVAVFDVANLIMADGGWLVILHCISSQSTLDLIAKKKDMSLVDRIIVHSSIALGWKTIEPRKEVHCFVLSSYKSKNDDIAELRYGMLQSMKTHSLQDVFEDTSISEEWIYAEGKALRGASQRSYKLWEHILLLHSSIEDAVVDLMCKTGSFLKIASLMGRHGIGIDNDHSLFSTILCTPSI